MDDQVYIHLIDGHSIEVPKGCTIVDIIKVKREITCYEFAYHIKDKYKEII